MANGLAQVPSNGRLFASSGQFFPYRVVTSMLLDHSPLLFLRKNGNMNALVIFLYFYKYCPGYKKQTNKKGFLAGLAGGPC